MSENLLYKNSRVDRQQAAGDSKKLITRAKELVEEKGLSAWQHADSHLLEGKASFHNTFKNALPSGEQDIRTYIEKTLAMKKGIAIGVELGGPGGNLFGDFSDGFFSKTAGITLGGSYDTKMEQQNRERNHTVIHGDLFKMFDSNQLEENIQSWLGENEKVDFIIERLMGGITSAPRNPYYLAKLANEWYERLSEGGILFAQLPIILQPLTQPWLEMVKKEYPNSLDVQFAPALGTGGGVLRLRKLHGAPNELPLLSPREVKNLYEH